MICKLIDFQKDPIVYVIDKSWSSTELMSAICAIRSQVVFIKLMLMYFIGFTCGLDRLVLYHMLNKYRVMLNWRLTKSASYFLQNIILLCYFCQHFSIMPNSSSSCMPHRIS